MKELDLYDRLKDSSLSIDKLSGFSYHITGYKIGRWNAVGINLKFAVNPNFLDDLDKVEYKVVINDICEKLIPGEVGYDIKDVIFIQDLTRDFDSTDTVDDLLKISVLNREAIQVLSNDIKDNLEEDKPELALDRLHTFSVSFFRELCRKHNLFFEKKDSLHTLLVIYRDHLEKSSAVESSMTIQIMKANTNILNNFNNVRNESSYAHDNSILNKNESKLICSHVIALLKFIDDIGYV